MGKALKAVGTAIVIVGAIAATGGAALAFGAGAGLLGSASLATSAVLSVGSFSVSAGALLTVGSLVSSVGGALSQPKVSTAGSALGWVGDPNGPMHFAVGRIAVAGDLRHKKAYGPNDRMYFSAVTVVSDAGPITEFESFTANDIPVTFGANGKADTSYFANVMWMRRQLGNQPEASYLASPTGLQNGVSLPDWGPSHKLSGKAAFVVTLAENSKGSAYKGQQPKPRHIIKGLRVYDWRQDSTYPGGAGSQRLNDPTTWTFSENPALWAAKWTYGLWEGPTGRGAPQIDYQVGGIGVTPGVIDFASLTELANIADTHGWKVAAWPSTDDDKAQVLNAFLQAAGAYYIEKSGRMSCLHRAAPRVSVATVTAADTAGPIELDTSSSYVDRKNTGVPTYLSEADGWKMTALGEVSAPEWVTQDGGRQRSMPMTYSFVPVAKQAAELMCLGIANTREGISGRIPLKPYMQGIEAGSAFTITEPEFVLNGLKCLALETSYDATTGVHTVTFVSETDGKYAYAYGQSPTPPAPPALEAVDPTFVTPPLPGDWTITPRPPSQGGGQVPGFDLSGVVSNETATAIIVEYGPSATGPWKQAYQGPPTVTNIPIDGVQPGATYYIAIQYQRNQNYSEREVFGPFTAPDLVAGDLSPESPTRIAVTEITDRLVSVEQISATNAAAVADLEEVFGDTASAAASAASAIQQAAIATQAKADAILAEGGALAAKADAIQAKSDALIAAGDAADRASEANEERIKAETARGQAEGFRNQSAASASTATGAASTATEQAGLAATARGEAQGFAGAALESRNQASGFATAAETAAAVSTSQKLEAVAALNAMGRQNIVARENVTTPADVFTVTTGGVSGWGFSMVGSGGNVTRSIKVGPLKANTAYSVSFKARRTSGSGSLPINVDLYPDTLPERTFDIQSSALTEFKWENITSPSTDMALATVLLRFFRAPLPTGYAYEITDIKLEEGATATAWTPSPKDAAASAKASAQSASQASASETAAGQQAATATQERIDAQTARGQAEGFRNQSAASATTATGAASTATEQAGLSASARDAAQGHASSALESRNQASGFVTAAEAAAAVSTTQKLEAIAARDIATEKATASAQSASNAAASETAAGQSASAANTAKVAAETARGQAQTAATNAATSETNAAGSASTAASQATLATNARNAANDSAQAAAGSASTASSKADEAGVQASAALASQVSATASRDQALKALLEQGRTNLVRRTRATAGQVVATSEGLSGWGFSMVGTGSGSQERSIAVGPLKQNTPYSLSFMARRLTGAGSRPITFDLFPDTLPERTFDIQSNVWTRYTWENFSSAHADMTLSTVRARFYRPNMEAGVNVEIAAVKLEEGATATAWTPSPFDAADSASAAATSAANASASDTAAGQKASAAEGSATTAATRAGEAQTYRNQASSSAADAATASINAGVSATTAQMSADGAASRAGGNIVALGSFSSGSIGTWTGSLANVAVSGVPDGSTRALRSTARDAYEGSFVVGAWGGRRLRVSGYGAAPGPYPLRVGVHGQTSANASHWVTGVAASAGNTSWPAFSFEIIVPADVSRLRPFVQSEGPSGATDHHVQVALLRIEDVTQSVAAASSAAAAQASAATASDSAAAASVSANLAASVGATRANLLYNSTGTRGKDGWGDGTNWYVDDMGYGFGWGFRTATNNAIIYTATDRFAKIAPGDWLTLSYDWKSQGQGGIRVWLEFYDQNGARISGEYISATHANRDFDPSGRTSREVQAPGNAHNARLVAKAEGLPASGTEVGFRRAKLERGRLPATAWTDDNTVAGLSASLSVTAAVAADAAARLASARFEVIAAAGNDPAQLLIRADTSGSLAALVASAIRFSNVVGGQVIEVMRLIGGEVFFMRPIYIDVGDKRLIVGPGGTWVLWFGGNDKNAAAATRTNGIFCLGTDAKIYYGSSELGSGGASGGSALDRTSITGQLSSTSWVTVASLTFANRPASGWWSPSISVSAQVNSQASIGIRVIEAGAGAALAETTSVVQGGEAPQIVEAQFSPPYAQTRPAGSIAVYLQMRRATGNAPVNVSGDFILSHTPKA